MTSEERKEYNNQYYQKNKKLITKKQREYVTENKTVINKRKKEWNHSKIEKGENYHKINQVKLKTNRKIYVEKNRTKIRESNRLYKKQIRLTNPLCKLKGNLRTMINKAIVKNGFSKTTKTHKILGCSYEEFKNYLESRFLPWMNWGNHGKFNSTFDYGWDIDHRIPLCSATNEAELIQLNHYTNLQPLCSHINRNIKRGNF